MKPFSTNSVVGKFILSVIQKYNHKKYWHRRGIVVDPSSRVPTIIKLWYLLYIKRVDSYHGSSFGINLNSGAHFSAPPSLPHGPAGIFVGHDVKIGTGVVIFQQVTIAHGGSVIGDNVIFGAGCKVLAGRNVGLGAKVGANCVVVEDIPVGATVVMPKPRIILFDDSRRVV